MDGTLTPFILRKHSWGYFDLLNIKNRLAAVRKPVAGSRIYFQGNVADLVALGILK